MIIYYIRMKFMTSYNAALQWQDGAHRYSFTHFLWLPSCTELWLETHRKVGGRISQYLTGFAYKLILE